MLRPSELVHGENAAVRRFSVWLNSPARLFKIGGCSCCQFNRRLRNSVDILIDYRAAAISGSSVSPQRRLGGGQNSFPLVEIGGIIVIRHIIKTVLVAIFCAARVVAPINGHINVTISDQGTLPE